MNRNRRTNWFTIW